MPVLHFITHPEVVTDPRVQVPDWPLSPEGIRRMTVAVEQPWMLGLSSMFSSAERMTALLPAMFRRLNSRRQPDILSARPEESVRGWERAADAQRRIVAAVERVITDAPGGGDVAVIAHGGVGALLLCHLRGVPISRTEDQPGASGGCVFSFDIATKKLLSGWRLIEG